MSVPEIMTVIVTPAIVLITGIIVVIQTKILKTQIDQQKTQIANLESYNKMFDLAKLKEANNFIMEGFTIKNEKEKEVILKEKEEVQQKLEEAYAKSKEHENLLDQVKVKDNIIHSKNESLSSVIQQLEDSLNANQSLQDQIYFYLNTNSELIGFNIKLLATFVKKDDWNKFIEKNTVEVAGLLKETMQTRGIAFLNELKRKKLEMLKNANAHYGNKGLLNKLIKSQRNQIYPNTLNYIPDYNYDELFERELKAYEESLNMPPEETFKTPDEMDIKTPDEDNIDPPKT